MYYPAAKFLFFLYVTLSQGILHSALHNEYWRLIDPQGKPTGVMGWWPSRAVTFLENHDTGSTQVSSLSLSLSRCVCVMKYDTNFVTCSFPRRDDRKQFENNVLSVIIELQRFSLSVIVTTMTLLHSYLLFTFRVTGHSHGIKSCKDMHIF